MQSIKALAWSLALVLLIGCSFMLMRPAKPSPKEVYFDLTALTEDGQPVAGAQVHLQGQVVGVTDSFGKWKKVHNLVFERLLAITIVKSSAVGELQDHKNLIISDEQARQEHPEITLSFKVAPKLSLSKTQRNLQGATEEIPSIWFQLSAPASELGLNDQYRYLEKSLVPALTQQARTLGIEIEATSPWQMRIISLAMPAHLKTPSLLRISVQHIDKRRTIDFLCGITGTATMVAEDIFKKLSYQLGSQPAEHGWKEFSVRLLGIHPQKASIFVGGYQAVPKDNNSWTYWGKRQQYAYLTVLEKNRITFRRRIVMGIDQELHYEEAPPPHTDNRNP